VTEDTPRLSVGQILTGPLFNEPMRVETVQSAGPANWIVGLVGTSSERFRKVTITAEDVERLTLLDPRHSFNGDGRLLRLGLQAYALGIAYEFDPYFGLSISRVDPLPHQLEAIYDYLLKLARVRFLLADDAGAGKTIMSGLLIRELELRGLAERILIVCPANLAFQWQRELKEKFDAKFLVMKGQDIRDQFGVNQWLPTAPTPEPGPAPGPGPSPSTRTLCVSGSVPPEVWNRLGTKILPKLRSGSDLKIGLEFSITVPADSANGLAAELRQVLQELGLAETVKVE
jgi:hypothetical protein